LRPSAAAVSGDPTARGRRFLSFPGGQYTTKDTIRKVAGKHRVVSARQHPGLTLEKRNDIRPEQSFGRSGPVFMSLHGRHPLTIYTREKQEMEFFVSAEISVPMYQLILFLLASTLALLFGRAKLALIANYLFALYWAYMYNRDFILEMGVEKFDYFTFFYFSFGVIVAILATIGFLYGRE
jgi:hypothetical protein